MKKYRLFVLLALCTSALNAQQNFYSQSIVQQQVNLRGGVVNLGQLTLTFPTNGLVVVHFDGECYASVGDLVVLAASQNGDWQSNDGNVSIENSKPGFGRPFSHTRVYQVTAGTHTYSAVGENVVERDGSGRATIYGTLSVEYFPEGTAVVESKGFTFSGDVTNTTVVAQQTIHASGAGKILVRFDGWLDSAPGDRIVLAASNNMSWGFNDGAVAVEAVNAGDVTENSFSHTRVYNVTSAGDYTYYAVSQNYGKKAGTGMISVHGNLLTEFFPTVGTEKIGFKGFTLPMIDLNNGPTSLTTIDFDAPEPGKLMLVLDGYSTADTGYTIIVAASLDGNYSANDGNIVLKALDLDQNRYSFSHTRTYNIGPGSHTFYAVGEITGGSGSKTGDLFGALTMKYIPFSSTPVADVGPNKNEFDLYPNPASDNVYITFRNVVDPKTIIKLLDVNGRLLKEYPYSQEKEFKIDLSGLPANQYWVQIGDLVKPLVKL